MRNKLSCTFITLHSLNQSVFVQFILKLVNLCLFHANQPCLHQPTRQPLFVYLHCDLRSVPVCVSFNTHIFTSNIPSHAHSPLESLPYLQSPQESSWLSPHRRASLCPRASAGVGV